MSSECLDSSTTDAASDGLLSSASATSGSFTASGSSSSALKAWSFLRTGERTVEESGGLASASGVPTFRESLGVNPQASTNKKRPQHWTSSACRQFKCFAPSL